MTNDAEPALQASASRDRTACVSGGIAWFIGAMVVLPALVALVQVAGRRWFPAGDWAMLELRTRDVGTSHTPLLGPYSRYGWNHPGPLLFWYYAVPYRLTGGASWSLLTAAATANGAAMAGMLAFAWRHGRVPLVAVTGLGLAVLVAHLDLAFLWDPWNPWVTVLPFGLLVLAAWAAGEGDRWGLPISVLTACFLVQTHIGFALVALGLVAFGAVGARRAGVDRRTWLIALGVGTVACLPMVLDQLIGDGNLGQVVGYFVGDSSDPAGLRRALHVLARELGGVAPWMGDPEPIEPIGGAVRGAPLSTLIIPFLAFIAAGAAAWGSGAASAVRLQAALAVAVVLGTISVSRISDSIYDYLVRWLWIVAMLWWVSVAWSVWRVLAQRVRAIARSQVAFAMVLAVAVAWTAVANIVDAEPVQLPAADIAAPIEALTPAIVEAVPDGASVLVEGTGPLVGWITDALVLQLDRAGIDVLLEDQQDKVGTHRTFPDRSPTARLLIASGTALDDVAGGLREIGRWDPLPMAAREERTRVEGALRTQLIEADRADLVDALDRGEGIWEATIVDGVDRALVEARDRYRAAGYPVAAFLQVLPDAAHGGTALGTFGR